MDPAARRALVIVAALALATAAEARRTCTDADAVAAARTDVETQCACERAANHRLYVRCAARVVRKRVRGGLLPRACAASVRRCAARSTCGRPGAVACCLGTRCKPMKRAARCTARGGRAGTAPSCCDACGTTGTVPTTTSSTLPGATTTLVTTTTTTSTTTLPEGYPCAQDASGGGTEPITCGTSVSCSLSPAGDTDGFTIAVPAAASISIQLSGSNNPCWDLRDPNGMSIKARCSDKNPQEAGPLPEGTYSILVTEALNRASNYVLSVQGINETFHCGTPITLPSTRVGDLSPAGDTDAYTLTVGAARMVSIGITGPNLPCWRLFDAQSGGLLKNVCDGTASVALPRAGDYTIVVRESLDRATTYSLSVQ